jgi:hypothetical protein
LVYVAFEAASEQRYGSGDPLPHDPSVFAYPLFSSMITRTCRTPEGDALLRGSVPVGLGVG